MTCSICSLLHTDNDSIVYNGEAWRVALNPNQEYLGRLFITLKTHKSSLSGLTVEEWQEFGIITQLLEQSLHACFQPTHFNWQCLMNDAIRDTQPPHVHWHLIPRYQATVEFNGTTYTDPSWPGKYKNVQPKQLTSDELEPLRQRLLGAIGRLL